MILRVNKSKETELSTKSKPDEENSLSTKESFTGKIGVTIGDLDNYNKDSLINIWKDANAYYSSGEEWTDEDAEFFDELAVRINTATEEGIGTVSGPAVGMVANKEFDYKNNEDEKAIKDEGLNGDDGLGFGQHNESLDQILLNETYIQDQFGVFYRPVYVGENYKEHESDLVFEGKLYTNEGVGNCPFCKGAGKITVEKLGLKDCPDCDGTGDIQGEQEMPQMEEPVEEEKPNPFAKDGESCGCKTKGLEASISKYEKFIKTEINVLKTRAKAGEAVGLMYGLPTVRKNGKKIKGTLAYAGVSLNDRIYLPEELAKGHGKTLPLLLNHSSTAGAEEELDRLDGEMRDHLENEKDYEVGEVTLTWDADKLTLFYEGVIENEFFQKEVDDMDMAVSLGIFYDSNSPKVCDEECYTLIKGAEFREVSLVYHAGFPIATIEAVESKLKRASIKDIKAKANESDIMEWITLWDNPEPTTDKLRNFLRSKGYSDNEITDVIEQHNLIEHFGESKANEDSLVKIEDNEDADTQVTVLDEWKNETDPDVDGETKGIRTTKESIAEEEDELPRGGSIDAEPKETDTIEQPQIIVESLQTQDSFSVRGVSGMTISNSNGVEKYAFDPTQNYSTNTIHFSVTEQGGTIFGEEMQLTPKMTTPDELTKEIESKPDIKFTDADEDILKKN